MIGGEAYVFSRQRQTNALQIPYDALGCGRRFGHLRRYW